MTQVLIDHAAYEELAEAMGADFAEELATTFLSEAPGMLAELKGAAAAGDAESYRRAAHSIKSNAEVFGAKALADQAREMELSGMENSDSRVPALEALYRLTATALKDLCNG